METHKEKDSLSNVPDLPFGAQTSSAPHSGICVDCDLAGNCAYRKEDKIYCEEYQ